MSIEKPQDTATSVTTETDAAPSRFDQFGGYYSVRFSGVEFARFAPSAIWSDYANSMQGVEGFSYAFVITEPRVAPPAERTSHE